MNKLFIWCFAVFMSCAGTPSQTSQDMQKNGEIIISESQGGADQPGFKMIKNEQELQNFADKGNSSIVEVGKEPAKTSLVFPKNKKVILYNLGMFRSGSHTITQIKSISVKDNILYVEVPAVESGGMEIQVISNPWFIFAVPSEYQFNSVALKYSK